MAKRKSMSKKLRFDVFKRDAFACQYCGAVPPQAILHVDHIVPVAEGGENEIDNLTTACSHCNLGKGASSLSAVPQSLSEKAASVQEQEDQLRGYADVMRAKKERIEEDAWTVARIFCDEHGIDTAEEGIDRKWFQGIKQFNERLGVFEVADAMEIAIENGPRGKGRCFKYFCGICWNRVRNLEAE